ncbi:MAG: TlpA disulfide reductase family protein [Balneolaceae bacterium]|nr:TlpA disulfide reductase family protein [Balneolaceae bacterium]
MKSKSFLFLVLGFLVFMGCSQENKNRDSNARVGETGAATEAISQLDPYSATLYPAKKEAKAQDFSVTLLDGETFTLSRQQGKVVIMNIWATWCAPCHDETPDFVDLYNEYKDEGLVILGVSIDEQGKSVVKPFVEKYEVNYPMVIDDGTIMDKYGPTMGIPTTYIINKKGNLQYFAVGALTQKELEPRINRLLNE